MEKRSAARVAGLALAAGGFAVAYGPVLARLAQNWWVDDNYSHAFLVLPLTLYIVWQRRHALAALDLAPSTAGLSVLLVSLLLLVAGTVGAEVFLSRVSMIGAIAGALLYVAGPRHLALLAFPLALLLLVIPLPSILFAQVTLPLQLTASWLGETALWAAGVPVLREGNVITLAHVRLEVAEACSGIRSLMSLVALATIYGYFSDHRWWLRTTLAVVAVPVAIVVNGLRIATTGLLAQRYGAAAAEGFFHAFSGWLMFLTAFALLAATHRLLVTVRPERERPLSTLVPTECPK